MKVSIDRKNIPLMLCLPLAFCFQTQDTEKAEAFELNVPINEPTPVFATKKVVDFSYLKEAKVGGLLSAYVGQRGQLPKKAEVDFRDQLEYLWDRKLDINGVTPATKKSADMIVTRYASTDPDYKGIKTFVHQIDHQSHVSYMGIDFSTYCAKMKISNKCGSLKKISSKITGKQIAAYGMTELFPSKSGKFNYILLDTLLRNAGETYIQSIPALGDPLLSIGFYQFTSHAIRHDATNVEGASRVNLYASKDVKIKGSVVALSNEEQHRAAYFFAVYNMTRLVQKLSPKDAEVLANKCSANEVTQFIATAHHLPTPAINKAVIWVENECKNKFQSYLGPALKEYATKTKNNLDELEKRV